MTTLVYDSGGNLIEDQEPTPTGQTARTTTYAYDSMNRLTTVTDPLGFQTIYGYDSDGNQVTVNDPMGRVTTTVFDALNRPTVVIDPLLGNRTTTTYDGDGQVIQVIDPMGRITTTTYDNRGWVATVTDPLGNVDHVLVYGHRHGIDGDKSRAAAAAQVSYVYDNDDRLIADIRDANGNTTTFSYDSGGNQVTVTDANNETTSYAYDSMNQVNHDQPIHSGDINCLRLRRRRQPNHCDRRPRQYHHDRLYDALNRATTITSPVSVEPPQLPTMPPAAKSA